MTTEPMPRAQLFSPNDALPFRGVEPGMLLRLDRDAYVTAQEWDGQFREARLRTLAEVVRRRTSHATRGAFSHATALAVHGLPVIDHPDDRVDMVVAGDHPRRSSRLVARHHGPLPDDDVCEVDGFAVTTLERTLFDVIRLATPAAAVVAMDAALCRAATTRLEAVPQDGADAFRDAVRTRIRAGAGARGIRQARFVVEFADERTDSPGESLMRWRVWQCSLGVVEPQFRVPLPGGRHALLDLALPERRLWFEFDGAVKTSDARMLAGRSPELVLAAQDARQRAVERTMGWRCVRFGWAEVRTLDAFQAALRRESLTR